MFNQFSSSFLFIFYFLAIDSLFIKLDKFDFKAHNYFHEFWLQKGNEPEHDEGKEGLQDDCDGWWCGWPWAEIQGRGGQEDGASAAGNGLKVKRGSAQEQGSYRHNLLKQIRESQDPRY